MELETLVSRGERYDVVTAFEVLEHLAEPRSFIQLLVNATSDQGQVFCTVPNWECGEVQTATRPDWTPPVHLGFFTRKSLGLLGESAGCRIVRTGVIYTDPPPLNALFLHRWLARRIMGIARAPLGLWLHLTR